MTRIQQRAVALSAARYQLRQLKVISWKLLLRTVS
jgi:hypothetical protein